MTKSIEANSGSNENHVSFYKAADMYLDILDEHRKAMLNRLVAVGFRSLTIDDKIRVINHIYWEQPKLHDVGMLIQAFSVSADIVALALHAEMPLFCRECREIVNVTVQTQEEYDEWERLEIYCTRCTVIRKAELRIDRRDPAPSPSLPRPSDEEIARLRGLPYPEYLQSEHWQGIRLVAIERDQGSCRVCRSAERLNVHHNTYDRLGCEELGDLLTLCQDCHELFHAHKKLSRPGS